MVLDLGEDLGDLEIELLGHHAFVHPEYGGGLWVVGPDDEATELVEREAAEIIGPVGTTATGVVWIELSLDAQGDEFSVAQADEDGSSAVTSALPFTSVHQVGHTSSWLVLSASTELEKGVWKLPKDGGAPELAASDVDAIAMATDGEHLFVYDANEQIGSLDLDTGEVTPLASDDRVDAFEAHGGSVYWLSSYVSGGYDVLTVPATGGEVGSLGEATFYFDPPRFSVDLEAIFFPRNNKAVVAIPVDGSDRRYLGGVEDTADVAVNDQSPFVYLTAYVPTEPSGFVSAVLRIDKAPR